MNLSVKNSENYAARIVTLQNFVPLPNRDKIKHAIINGSRVIVSIDAKEGQKGVFFPVETAISASFLSKNNLFSDKELNANKEKTGFFQSPKNRVKAVKFAGNVSDGFFIPLESLIIWKPELKLPELEKLENNTAIDTVNGEELCRKYIPVVASPRQAANGKKIKKKIKSRIIPEFWNFHYDTQKLGVNIHLLEPDDNLLISNKLHGTSQVTGRVLVRRPLSFIDKIAKFFGAKIIETHYDNIYSSRAVIKNDLPTDRHDHYYKEDVWAKAFDELSPFLTDGLTFYSEIVGYTQGGSYIQKPYDYFCNQGESKVFIYRITRTSTNGKVEEFPMREVIRFCKVRGLNHVPVLFDGKASEFLPQKEGQSLESWRNEFIEKLRKSYDMEKNCSLCKNPVPAEGVVVRIDSKSERAFKFKSFLFLKKETEDLDKGEVDTETAESIVANQ